MAEWIDISRTIPDRDVLDCLPASMAHENVCLPLRRDNDGILMIVVADPDHWELAEKIRFILNQPVRTVGADAVQLKFAIWRCYGPPEET